MSSMMKIFSVRIDQSEPRMAKNRKYQDLSIKMRQIAYQTIRNDETSSMVKKLPVPIDQSEPRIAKNRIFQDLSNEPSLI